MPNKSIVYFKSTAWKGIVPREKEHETRKGRTYLHRTEGNMTTEHNRIVYPRPDGTWANRPYNDEIPTTIHDTKNHAVAAAKSLIKNQGGGSLTVLGHDGRVILKTAIPPREPIRPAGGAVG
jgi:hypothetical protein